MDDRFCRCLETNRVERSWINKEIRNTKNPVEMPRHKMLDGFMPECRLRCPCSNSCEETWE